MKRFKNHKRSVERSINSNLSGHIKRSYQSTINEKKRYQEWAKEHKAGGFRCSHCRQFVVINDMMGTANRNHCNLCLWSRHVDEGKGDRKADCYGGMQPIGLTFKHEGIGKQGEVMLIHLCSVCQRISINRIARDDLEQDILNIFEMSLDMSEATKDMLDKKGVTPLSNNERVELNIQLYGQR